jgi:hypothetical protein
MSRKSGSTRTRVQRNKSRSQKSIELVHSHADSPMPVAQQKAGDRSITNATTTSVSAEASQSKEAADRSISTAEVETAHKAGQQRRERIPLRRQAVPLMTAEEQVYVRRDLTTICLLSVLMVSIIIVLYVLLG